MKFDAVYDFELAVILLLVAGMIAAAVYGIKRLWHHFNNLKGTP